MIQRICFIVTLTILLYNCNNVSHENKTTVCFIGKNIKNVKQISFKDIRNADTINYVEIDGYFHFLFEDVGIYPSRSSNSQDALSLDFDSSFNSHAKELENLSGKLVSITGVLGNSNGLHNNVYRKTLYEVICIKEK